MQNACYDCGVTVRKTDLQVRGVPVALRERLRRRAASRGASMSQYVIEIRKDDLPRAHQLADRIAAPDSFYVALSELMRARLLTADAHLSSAATGIVEVQFVGAG